MEESSRAGKEHRINKERYFHVMGQGWFVLTREGINGPYDDKKQVTSYLNLFLNREPDVAKPEESDPWEKFYLK
ncbi:MAG: hypothetical protein LJE73_07185 [Proteobacteria bacterium]|jgi:hypothetical protein|nr:hypothetical protein [Pseudomonadota bacterium]